MRHETALYALLLATLAGCGDSEEEEFARLVEDFAARTNLRTSIRCECWQERDFASREDCEAAGDQVRDEQLPCIIDAFTLDREASKAALECGTTQGFNECLSEQLDCTRAGMEWLVCQEMTSSCPAVPSEVNDAFQMCFWGD